MKIGDIYELKIDKLSNHGLGIGKINGTVVFVPNSCPDDLLKVKISKINKHYMSADIIEITAPSPFRTTAFCPLQKVCGACQLQFIDYNAQLKFKRQIVEDAMHSIGGFDIYIPDTVQSPKIKGYRSKIQYPVFQTKNSKRILAGYYKPASHEIVNIKYCPIQPEICDKIIEFIRETANEFNISGYNEKKHKGILKHILIRHSSLTGKCLICLVINKNEISKNFIEFCQNLYNNFTEVSGVCVNFNPKQTNVILADRTECVCGDNFIEENLCDKTFQIGAETFFQVNIGTAQNIFNYIKEFINKNCRKPLILDAYAGISTIGICLSDCAEKIVSIEENKKSVELAIETAKHNNINNIEIHGGDAEEFLKKEERKFDVVILDPPRKGCSINSLNYALKLCKEYIIYVSCNPATLARDLKMLKEKGCCIESIQPFDMFCHTYHIENVAIIKMPH